MPVSEKKRRSNDAYNAKCDVIQIRPIKPVGAAIRAAAQAARAEPAELHRGGLRRPHAPGGPAPGGQRPQRPGPAPVINRPYAHKYPRQTVPQRPAGAKGGFLMSDHIPVPNVKNIVRAGDFTLYVYAFRPLTEYELKCSASQWLKETKRRSFPKSGEASVFTIYGFDQ